jgi:hypothetical protein
VAFTWRSRVSRWGKIRVGNGFDLIIAILACFSIRRSKYQPITGHRDRKEHTCRDQQGFCRDFFYWSDGGMKGFFA